MKPSNNTQPDSSVFIHILPIIRLWLRLTVVNAVHVVMRHQNKHYRIMRIQILPPSEMQRLL